MIKLKGTYRLPIGFGMIGNSIYIVTCLSGLIQEVKLLENTYIQLLQRNTILDKMIEWIVGLAIKNLKHSMTMSF